MITLGATLVPTVFEQGKKERLSFLDGFQLIRCIKDSSLDSDGRSNLIKDEAKLLLEGVGDPDDDRSRFRSSGRNRFIRKASLLHLNPGKLIFCLYINL